MLNHLNKHNVTGAAGRQMAGGAGQNDRGLVLFSQKHGEMEKEATGGGRMGRGIGRFASALFFVLSTHLAVAQDIPQNVPMARSNDGAAKMVLPQDQKAGPAIAGETPVLKNRIPPAPKISIPDSAAYIFGYEYISIHSGKAYDIESMDSHEGIRQPLRRVEGLRILGGLELEKNDACIFAYQTILYGDFAYVQIHPQAGLMLAIPRSEIVAIRIRDTEYEIKISGSALETELSIQKIGSDDPRDVYATVLCARAGPAFGVADYLDGEKLRAMAGAGALKVQPVSEENLDGFPAYNLKWKKTEIALPREK